LPLVLDYQDAPRSRAGGGMRPLVECVREGAKHAGCFLSRRSCYAVCARLSSGKACCTALREDGLGQAKTLQNVWRDRAGVGIPLTQAVVLGQHVLKRRQAA